MAKDPTDKIVTAAKKLDALRDEKKRLEDELKEVNKQKGKLEMQTLPKLMADAEIQKMSIEGIGTLFTKNNVFAHIREEDRPKAFDWFRDNGHGGLIKETVHFKTLTSWAKEQLEEGKEVPKFCNAKPVTLARIRRD